MYSGNTDQIETMNPPVYASPSTANPSRTKRSTLDPNFAPGTTTGTARDVGRMYEEQILRGAGGNNGNPLEDTVSLGPNTTTTGVCIDEKVLKQISDNQAKYMQDRIVRVEMHFGNLCESFAAYARSIGKLRDKGDMLTQIMNGYAYQEELNLTAKQSMLDFCTNFSTIQDYREAEVRRIEDKVVKPLTLYGQACKHSKERLKGACEARKKELKQQKALEKSREKNPYDSRHTMKFQSDIHKAKLNALRAESEVEQEMESFERKKLDDLQQILRDFITVEMLYHSKALELLSDSYQKLTAMNVEQDLEQFLSSMRPITTQSRQKTQQQGYTIGGIGDTNRFSSLPPTMPSTTATRAAVPATTAAVGKKTTDPQNRNTRTDQQGPRPTTAPPRSGAGRDDQELDDSEQEQDGDDESDMEEEEEEVDDNEDDVRSLESVTETDTTQQQSRQSNVIRRKPAIG